MAVLKNVTGKWRLFWVLEVIGLSFLLAVLSIKVTGNATSVGRKERSDRSDNYCSWGNCSIYAWYFIIHVHPIAVTVCAMLATLFVATFNLPSGISRDGRLRRAPVSPGWVAFTYLVLLWLGVGLFRAYSSHSFIGFERVFGMRHYRPNMLRPGLRPGA